MHKSKHMYASSTRGWVTYWTSNTGLCIKKINYKVPPKIIKLFPTLLSGNQRKSSYSSSGKGNVFRRGDGEERQHDTKEGSGVQISGRPAGEGTLPGREAMTIRTRPPGTARTSGGRSPRGRQQGRARTRKDTHGQTGTGKDTHGLTRRKPRPGVCCQPGRPPPAAGLYEALPGPAPGAAPAEAQARDGLLGPPGRPAGSSRCRYLGGGGRTAPLLATRPLSAADIERDAAMTLSAATGRRRRRGAKPPPPEQETRRRGRKEAVGRAGGKEGGRGWGSGGERAR